VWLESRATTIRVFDTNLVPGLLQTRDYAQAVITATAWAADAEQITRWVKVRMDRQAVLHRDAPPRVAAIIDEFVLRREVGGPDVLASQLAHLLSCAKLPHLDLRVLLARGLTRLRLRTAGHRSLSAEISRAVSNTPCAPSSTGCTAILTSVSFSS
jgi:uncharacterized protein DUF5753